MNILNSNASGDTGNHHRDQTTILEHDDAMNAGSESKRAEWAENWFAGSACCPVCGSDDMQIVRAHGDGSGRIEDWRCASKSCASQWRVELRESAVGIYRDVDGIEVDWYERAGCHSDALPAEVHTLFVASTSHVTPQEGQALTDHNYARGEYGWFFYVGPRGGSVLPEFDSLSQGLSEVVRQARARGCFYVLLDRDANPLNGIPTYDW
jgi:hypothetical protein